MGKTYEALEIDFLGNLRKDLTGLAGFQTLALEIIQNAEDAKANKLSFTFTDRSLIIENDSSFSEKDFENIKKISSGGKKNNPELIGTYGIGFVSVYQITDCPELISSGRHWKFNPDSSPQERIEVSEYPAEYKNTKFILPWAFQDTNIRKELDQSPITLDYIENFKKELIDILPKAILFLINLKTIEVYIDDQVVYTTERQNNRNDKNLTIRSGMVATEYLLLVDEFSKHPTDRKTKYEVFIAIPKLSLKERHLLYIYLPSTIHTNFPFDVMADFYPTFDRKSIIIEGDEKAEWNKRAINSIAKLLASKIIEIRDRTGHDVLLRSFQACKDYSNDSIFGDYWKILKPVVSDSEIVLTSTDKWAKPNEPFIFRKIKEEKYIHTLQKLTLQFTNPAIRSYYSLLREIGVREFKIEDLIEAIKDFNIVPGNKLDSNKSPFNTKEDLINIYKEFSELLEADDDANKQEIESLVIGLSQNGNLDRLKNIRRFTKEEKETFDFLKDKIQFADVLDLGPNKIIDLIPKLSIEDLIDELSNLSKENYLELYSNESVNFLSVYDYFADNEKKIISKTDLKDRFKKIPMFLAHDEFKALDDLSLPGPFKDPLKLDILIQEKLNGKVTDFLKKIGVNELDLLTYCRIHLPKALSEKEISKEENKVLVDELISNFSQLIDDKDVINKISGLKIVECEDELLRTAKEVYFNNDILVKIFKDKEFHVVSYPQNELNDSSKDFYKSIGVTETPRAKDIIEYIKKIIINPPDENNNSIISDFFYFINDKWEIYKTNGDDLNELKTLKWLPTSLNDNTWYKPNEIFSNTRRHLFSSQAKFIKFGRTVSEEFAKFLELRTEPNIQQVIDHLLYCSQNSTDVHTDVYTYLNLKADDEEINQLINTKCINIPVGTYLSPNEVYWFDNPFGNYRYLLNASLRNYTALFNKVGVKEKPDVDDHISIVEEISNKFGNQNSEVDEESLKILNNSFIFLQLNLNENQNLENKLQRLKSQKIIPQCKKLLQKPKYLFFEDKPNLSRKFGNKIIEHIITRDASNYLVFEKLGVRFLSKAISKSFDPEVKTYNSKFKQLLRSFEKPVLRIIENRKKNYTTGWNEGLLDKIEVFDVKDLEVNYELEFQDNYPIKAENIQELVFFDDTKNIFYLKEGEGIKSRIFAKEFATALNYELDTSDLSPLLFEIFNSKNLNEAEAILDEYDIDKTFKSETIVVDSSEAIGSIGSYNGEDSTPIDIGEEKIDSNDNNDLYGFDITQAVQENKSTYKLRSYVLPPNSDSSLVNRDQYADKEEIDKIDKAGVEKVLQYEIDQGRFPFEMSHSNEGYDIESKNANGELERIIEVKSTRKKWDGFEVELSDSQFFKAKDEGNKFYLYVVDKVFSEDCRIYEINNPANKATGFLFDSAWKDS